jgi:hypothetical protein
VVLAKKGWQAENIRGPAEIYRICDLEVRAKVFGVAVLRISYLKPTPRVELGYKVLGSNSGEEHNARRVWEMIWGVAKELHDAHLPTEDTWGGSGIDGMYGCNGNTIGRNAHSSPELKNVSAERVIVREVQCDVSAFAASTIRSFGLY